MDKTVKCKACNQEHRVKLSDGPAPHMTLCGCGELVQLVRITARQIGGLSTSQQAGPIR